MMVHYSDIFHLKQFEALLSAHDCPCRVAILEENNCQAHFTRALADVFTSNYLQTKPLVAMQATSQLWSRAGNFKCVPLLWCSPMPATQISHRTAELYCQLAIYHGLTQIVLVLL